MSDEEGGGDVANPCVDWIVARVGDTRPASFKMAEVGKMKIDENSQCEPPPCMRHNCREPAETLTRAAAQVCADRLCGRRGREARADLLGPEEQRPHRRPECAGHVRAPFVIPRDRFFPPPKRGLPINLRGGRCRPPLPSPVTRRAILAQVQEEHKVDVVRQDVEVQAGGGG